MKLDLTGRHPALDLHDSSLLLTADQRRAMGFEREVAVTAGAGAGKTHTLSLRYTALLLDVAVREVLANRSSPRPDIESVLVLTFTEKAAEEMADRCYKRLLTLAAAVRDGRDALDARAFPGFGLALAAAIDHLVDTIDLAQISTFHGFCSRLLREFPAETGTPPGFDVLEPLEARELMRRSAAEALQGVIDERREDLALLLDSWPTRRWLLDAVVAAMGQRGVLRERLTAYATDQVTIDELLDTAVLTPADVRSWLQNEASPVLARIAAIVSQGPGGKHFDEAIRPMVGELHQLPDDPLSIYEVYSRTLECLLTTSRNPTVRKLDNASVIGKKGDWPSVDSYTRAKDDLKALQDRVEDWATRKADARLLPGPADRVMLDALGAFARLTLDALQRNRTLLADERAIDFAEMQIRAVDAVLGDAELRDRLRRRYRYLMVDEFQDTDAQQWAMVRALGRTDDDTPSDRIFLVGDVKQAIYGFRGGDVTVFRTATRALNVDPVVLPDNFRSRTQLIAWFNAFFASAMGAPSPTRPAHEAPYTSLNAGRGEAGGSVVLITHEDKRTTDAALTEAEAVAHLLAAEVLPGTDHYAGLALGDTDLHPTPPIALLLRARTHMRVFEDALRRHGVPYVVASGIGFWERPEIVDLVNALHALATQDPLSVLGVLRSPLFGVPDQALHDLTLGRLSPVGAPRHHGLHRFGTFALDPGAPVELQRAEAAWRRLLALRDRLPVAMLLREVLSAGVAWHAYAVAEPSGQAEANAGRLVELASTLDARGMGLDGVSSFCLQQVEDATPETEAAVTPAAARVMIMTVHASKGLEFPVVVVPGLGAPPPSVNPSVAIRRVAGEWDLACRVTSPTAKVRKRVRPGRYNQLEQVREVEEDAESLRLLYVACTRARDHLILLGSDVERDPDSRDTWMDAINRHHGQPATSSDGLAVRTADDVTSTPLPRAGQPLPPTLPGPDATRGVEPIYVEADFEISPSSLDLYTRCPAWWYLRQVMRIPDARTRAAELERTLARVRGNVLHGLLEDDLADDEGVARRRWSAMARAEGASEKDIAAGWKALRAHLRRAAADPTLRRVLDSKGMSEVEFRLPYKGLVLRGQIDRLWFDDKDQCWVVLDYKSEHVHGSPISAAREHERQLLAYAWAASQVLVAYGGEPVERGEVYFTDTGYPFTLANVGPAAFKRFEALLDEVSQTVGRTWSEVEAAVTGSDERRPCGQCPFHGRGCRGKDG